MVKSTRNHDIPDLWGGTHNPFHRGATETGGSGRVWNMSHPPGHCKTLPTNEGGRHHGRVARGGGPGIEKGEPPLYARSILFHDENPPPGRVVSLRPT